MPVHFGMPWSDADRRALNDMYWQTEPKWDPVEGAITDQPKYSRAQLAAHFNRTTHAIDTALCRFSTKRGSAGQPLPATAKVRTCMPCRKPFMSMSAGNRICRRCALKIEAGQMECA